MCRNDVSKEVPEPARVALHLVVPESSEVMKAVALQSATFRPTQPVETDKGSLPFHPASPGSL